MATLSRKCGGRRRDLMVAYVKSRKSLMFNRRVVAARGRRIGGTTIGAGR